MDPTHEGTHPPPGPTHTAILTPTAPTDAHAMHRAIHAATRSNNSRVLWARPAPDRLVIRTNGAVDWAELPGAIPVGVVLTVIPQAGEQTRWALVANPCRATGSRDPATGRLIGRSKRVPLPEPEWEPWVRRKLAAALDVDQVEHTLLPGWTGRPRDGRRPITLTRVAFAGTATVTNQDALTRLLADGVGPGKAFGCGLLLVEAER